MRTRTTMGCIDAPLEGFSLPGRGGGGEKAHEAQIPFFALKRSAGCKAAQRHI